MCCKCTLHDFIHTEVFANTNAVLHISTLLPIVKAHNKIVLKRLCNAAGILAN